MSICFLPRQVIDVSFCGLGPIWGISNVKYGYSDEATELAEKAITLFGMLLGTDL